MKALAQVGTAVAQSENELSVMPIRFPQLLGGAQQQYTCFCAGELRDTRVLAVGCCRIPLPGHNWDNMKRMSTCDPEASYEIETLKVSPASAAFCSRGSK